MSPRRFVALLTVVGLVACGSNPSGGTVDASSSSPSPSPTSPGPSVAVHWGTSTVTFASIEEGRGVLGAEDDFTRALGPLDRQLRMGVTTTIGDGAYRAHVAAQVIAWKETDSARWEAAAIKLGDALRGLELSLPKSITLIETTGKDELDAAYTRGAAIVLPAREIAESKSPLNLLAHELFHVATRHDPGLRKRLFPKIGFQPVDAVALPKALEPKRLTNPDAFLYDFAIRVHTRKGDRSFLGIPVLYCALPLEDALREGLGRSIGISLVELDDAGKPVSKDGEPVLHDVGATDFMQLASINTGYAIHPEEVLADNFALALAARAGESPKVDKPDVLEAIVAALTPR